MKILQINAVNSFGSTGRNMAEKSAFLRAHGIDCHTAYSVGESNEYDYRIGSAADEKLHALLSRLTGLQGYFSYFATRRLLRHIREYDPDIVELNNLHGNYINLRLLLSYLARKDIATVLVLHDCWFYTGKCCHYTVNGCDRWQRGCGECGNIHQNNNSYFFDRTKKMWADKQRWFENIPRLCVIGVSDWITAEAQISPIFHRVLFFKRVYNWIDTDVFRRRDTQKLKTELGLDGQFVILGVASKWSDSKGLNSFLELATQLSEEAAIVLVGEMDERSFPENVFCVGRIASTEELAAYYVMADVFLTLSLEESFGKAAAEALSCGTPVIAFDSTANGELAVCPEFLVRPGDIQGIVTAVRIQKNRRKETCADECAAFAKNNFGMEVCLESYIRAYSDLMEYGEEKRENVTEE